MDEEYEDPYEAFALLERLPIATREVAGVERIKVVGNERIGGRRYGN